MPPVSHGGIPLIRITKVLAVLVLTNVLLFSGAIQIAGSVKARKASRHATSDWMEIEKQRGISVASSVMQMAYRDHVVNLLDTPGHKDFSEDTYRVLTAVDAAIMVVDAAKGVEEQTIKLLEVCRMRNTPIITFINKLDREVREPLELLELAAKVDPGMKAWLEKNWDTRPESCGRKMAVCDYGPAWGLVKYSRLMTN